MKNKTTLLVHVVCLVLAHFSTARHPIRVQILKHRMFTGFPPLKLHIFWSINQQKYNSDMYTYRFRSLSLRNESTNIYTHSCRAYWVQSNEYQKLSFHLIININSSAAKIHNKVSQRTEQDQLARDWTAFPSMQRVSTRQIPAGPKSGLEKHWGPEHEFPQQSHKPNSFICWVFK